MSLLSVLLEGLDEGENVGWAIGGVSLDHLGAEVGEVERDGLELARGWDEGAEEEVDVASLKEDTGDEGVEERKRIWGK